MDPLSGEEWDECVSGHPDAGFFHYSAWARVLAKTYGHKPFYHVLFVSGRPAVLLPLLEVDSPLTGRRGVCLPFSDFCQPLFFQGFESAPIVPFLTRLGTERKWRHFEVRSSFTGLPPNVPPAVSFYIHRLDLRKGIDALEASLHSSHRRSLKKAGQSGLRVETRADLEAMEIYFNLHTRTRRRHGLPPQPRAFFRNIHKEMMERNLGFVALAFHSSQPVAGAVFFHAGDEAVYKFGASAGLENTLRANHAVMWHGISHLAEKGAASLHFGRTSLSQDGLRRYKSNWGALESVIDYYRFDLRNGQWKTIHDNAGGGHNALFSRFPLALNRLFGTVIYPHLD